jgi:carboxypeptidase D
VANYPYDNRRSGRNVYTSSPDDDIFRQISLAYSYGHETMHLGEPCDDRGGDPGFPDGITNGAEWYNVDGGMQDYNYLHHSSCFEITIEQGCQKYPYASELEGIWNANRDALILFIGQVHIGVKGVVRDENGTPISNARIDVVGRSHSVFSTEDGDYWRLLVPGSYTLKISAPGYNATEKSVVVSAATAAARAGTSSAAWTNFTLQTCEQCSEAGGFTPTRSLILLCGMTSVLLLMYNVMY